MLGLGIIPAAAIWQAFDAASERLGDSEATYNDFKL